MKKYTAFCLQNTAKSNLSVRYVFVLYDNLYFDLFWYLRKLKYKFIMELLHNWNKLMFIISFYSLINLMPKIFWLDASTMNGQFIFAIRCQKEWWDAPSFVKNAQDDKKNGSPVFPFLFQHQDVVNDNSLWKMCYCK